MKVEELRIGNLVKDKDGDLVKISPVLIRFAASFDPVELDEELLKRFGFQEKRHLYYQIGNFEYCMGNGIIDNGYAIVNYEPIKYVHQLQNLYFALTGNELTDDHDN